MDTRREGWLVSDSGVAYPLSRSGDTTIGRMDCDLNIDEPEIGWKHATIGAPHDEVHARYLYWSELTEDDSVEVNDETVQFRAIIRPGDRIRLGRRSNNVLNRNLIFTYEVGSSQHQQQQPSAIDSGQPPAPEPRPQLRSAIQSPQDEEVSVLIDPILHTRYDARTTTKSANTTMATTTKEQIQELKPIQSTTNGLLQLRRSTTNTHHSLRPTTTNTHHSLRPTATNTHHSLRPTATNTHHSLRPTTTNTHHSLRLSEKITLPSGYGKSKTARLYQSDRPRDMTDLNATSLRPMLTMIEGLQLYYDMKSKCRGLCLIISNEDYSTHYADGPSDRRGSEFDEIRLTKVFRTLGFHVEMHKNVTAQKIQWEIDEVATRNASRFDCFVCVLLAHGTRGRLIGTDNKEIRLASLIDAFNNDECVSLRDKPKLFFVQACRGGRLEVANRRQQFLDSWLPDDHQGTARGPVDSDDGYSFKSIPRCADYLTYYATSSGYAATRSVHEGSIFIQVLCEELEKYGKKLDLHTILTIVNQKVSQKEILFVDGQYVKQMPEIRSTLTKLVKF